MPSRPNPLWWPTIALLVMAPATNILSWWPILVSGVLPHDKDSVAIPMFSGVIVTLLIAPFVITVTWFCLRRYDPQARLLAWRADRPLRSVFATLVFGGPAGLFVLTLAYDLRDMPGGDPWRAVLFTGILPPGIAWLLAMRAALIEQGDAPPGARPDRPTG